MYFVAYLWQINSTRINSHNLLLRSAVRLLHGNFCNENTEEFKQNQQNGIELCLISRPQAVLYLLNDLHSCARKKLIVRLNEPRISYNVDIDQQTLANQSMEEFQNKKRKHHMAIVELGINNHTATEASNAPAKPPKFGFALDVVVEVVPQSLLDAFPAREDVAQRMAVMNSFQRNALMVQSGDEAMFDLGLPEGPQKSLSRIQEYVINMLLPDLGSQLIQLDGFKPMIPPYKKRAAAAAAAVSNVLNSAATAPGGHPSPSDRPDPDPVFPKVSGPSPSSPTLALREMFPDIPDETLRLVLDSCGGSHEQAVNCLID